MATMADKWFQDGVEKRNYEIAQNMISKGFDTMEIHEIPGLSLEQIEYIRKKGLISLTSGSNNNVEIATKFYTNLMY